MIIQLCWCAEVVKLAKIIIIVIIMIIKIINVIIIIIITVLLDRDSEALSGGLIVNDL